VLASRQLTACLWSSGQPFNEREHRRKHLAAGNESHDAVYTSSHAQVLAKKKDRDGEPLFRDVTRQVPRHPGERHVLPVVIPHFARLSARMEGDDETENMAAAGAADSAADESEMRNGELVQQDAETAGLNGDHLGKNGAIPARLELGMLEDKVQWIERAGLDDIETAGQLGGIGKTFISEQKQWSKQLDTIINGCHVYMDQLMPPEMDFDHHDAFLPLESLPVPGLRLHVGQLREALRG
jgi:hypothetical protein